MVGASAKTAPESAAGDAHVPRHRCSAVAAIDNEVMTLGLARNGGGDCRRHGSIALRRPERRAQIGGIGLAEAHEERAGTGQPHAVAALAEIMSERRDHAEAPAGL